MKKEKWTHFVCPHCDHNQTEVNQVQKVWQYSLIDLKDGELTGEEDTQGGDIEGYTCPECGEDLPQKLVNLLNIN